VREAPAAATEKDPGILPSSPLLSKISAAAAFQHTVSPGQCQGLTRPSREIAGIKTVSGIQDTAA
jgi:hypothetical protein